jgi:hypothetical protein
MHRETLLYHLGHWIIQSTYQEESFSDYSCDDLPSEDITISSHEIKVINSITGRIHIYNLEKDWRLIRRIYRAFSKGPFPLSWGYSTQGPNGLTRKVIYSWFRPYMPYAELTAKQQMNSDKRAGRYPAIDSKYFDKIPEAELKALIIDLQIGIAENRADNVTYNEAWRNASAYMRTQTSKLNQLTNALKQRL